ncbi:MAG: cobalamin B12-binding domain-containing protein, partial [Deltaproteobacteria bacterium]|nr:cobalamin B12-binding domain-containing protein [Deltaproteobacteria bacterium]
MPVHPLGSKANILLTSVFGPYARDDEYGSRRINPMELYHNQVTREQGPFSLRMFHRSFGLLLLKENIQAPCTMLDFPDQERFIHEISHNDYDIVGISAIMPNIGKVKRMCRLIREHLPGAAIVIGGHIANMSDLADRVEVDHICRGEGVSWFRRYLGLDEHAPIKHPHEMAGFGTRILG